MELAKEILKTAPFIGIEETRLQALIVIGKCEDGAKPTLSDFSRGGTYDRLKNHAVAYKESDYLDERIKALAWQNDPQSV